MLDSEVDVLNVLLGAITAGCTVALIAQLSLLKKQNGLRTAIWTQTFGLLIGAVVMSIATWMEAFGYPFPKVLSYISRFVAWGMIFVGGIQFFIWLRK